ncbi:DUF401 family protein [Eubacteriales bacterium OttesenSCG-928-M02]|nr:DUF401 family protein [Eubacteriales bacterium OttesenSCG-928-M02]
MFALAMVLVSFLTIPLLSRVKKLGIGGSLVITAIVMAVLNGFGPTAIWNVFLDVFRGGSSSLNTVLVVAAVGIMGTLMKEYKMLDKVVEALTELVSSARLLFILIPALVGTLTIPGGAILSAPFVNDLGEKVGMKPEKRAACNLIFRHVSVFILPYSSSLLIVSAMLPFQIYQLILVNLVFAIPMVLIGYFIYLRDIPKKLPHQRSQRTTGQNIFQLLLYSSPIYACIIVNMITGLPLYACMLVSILIIFLLSPKTGFLKLAVSAIGYNSILAVIGVFMISGIVQQLPSLIAIFEGMFRSGTFMLLALVLASLFFGLITGFQTAPMSIVFPMLLTLSLGKGELLAYTYIVYVVSFLGYYFSPLHMCQLFTCEYMGVKMNGLYRAYMPYVLAIILWLAISYTGLRILLPIMMG